MDGNQSKIKARILAAAADLFSRSGYSGVSTREIASLARVNEVTIYRHFPRKRDLYLAVLAEELGRVHLRGDQLKEVAEATSPRQALVLVFKLIEMAILERPLLLPLILHGALESSTDVDTLLRRHLGEFVEVVARYLDPWTHGSRFISHDSRDLVMTLVSIAVFRHSLKRVFPSAPAPTAAVEAFADLSTQGTWPEMKGPPDALQE